MKAVTVGRFQDGGEHGLCSFGEHIELPMVPATRGSPCLKPQLSLIIHWAVGKGAFEAELSTGLVWECPAVGSRTARVRGAEMRSMNESLVSLCITIPYYF